MIKFIKNLFIKKEVKDINYYKNKNFTREQLEWIELGLKLEFGEDVEYYAKENYSPELMHKIYDILAEYHYVKLSKEYKKELKENKINLLIIES